MTELDLNTAVRQIKQTCENNDCPFFFVVGAGISAPEVPLAAEIVQHCKKKAIADGVPEHDDPKDPLRRYSHWFSQAYPSPKDRQQYLRSLIEGKPISHANLRLAHLLVSRKIARIVVTLNFDDFLLRALRLFGEAPLVSDHPQTLARIDLANERDIQVLHVHGVYWFYDLCNLEGEIKERAKDVDELLELILWNRSPIVVGYSGWEHDVVMTVLKKILNRGRLPFNLYWCCYRRNEIQRLPDWLKEHSSVRFVVPPRDGRAELRAPWRSSAASPIGLGVGAHDFPMAGVPGQGWAGAEPEGSADTLPAQRVFDRLIEAFKLDAPPLIRDPLGFLAEHIPASLPPPREDDLYRLDLVGERLRRAQILLARDEKEVQQPLARLIDAVRTARYREAIDEASAISLERLDARRLEDLLHAALQAALGLSEDPEQSLRGYQVALEAYRKLPEDKRSVLQGKGATAQRGCGIALAQLGRFEEAVAAYGKLVQDFEAATDLSARSAVAWALADKGHALVELGRLEDALAAYDQVVQRFGDARTPTLQPPVASALLGKGELLARTGDDQAALETYDDLIRRFGDASELAVASFVARALMNRAGALARTGRKTEAAAAYEEVARRLESMGDPAWHIPLGWALLSKGDTLAQLGRSQEAIAAYDDAVQRFGNATEPELQEITAWALLKKGNALADLGRIEEAHAAYGEVLDRFGTAQEPRLSGPLAWAELRRGHMFVALDQREKALDTFESLVRRFANAREPALKAPVGWACLAKGQILSQLERHQEAMTTYQDLVAWLKGATEPELRLIAAWAGVKLGDSLAQLGRTNESRRAFSEVICRFEGASDMELQKIVAKARERLLEAGSAGAG
ncbi:MAG: tetratricopeptide repeat protein [Bryobacterales bacterium]|nr:tetratricopeptide repeat protein [Bryobacterales bacterium]